MNSAACGSKAHTRHSIIYKWMRCALGGSSRMRHALAFKLIGDTVKKTNEFGGLWFESSHPPFDNLQMDAMRSWWVESHAVYKEPWGCALWWDCLWSIRS